MVERVRSIRDPKKSSNGAEAAAKKWAPFGPPPLIEGEDGVAYDELLARVSAGVQPKDIIEDIWVRDVVDLVWEALRLRRTKACLMTIFAGQSLAATLAPLIEQESEADEESEANEETDEAEADQADEQDGDCDDEEEEEDYVDRLVKYWEDRDLNALAEVKHLLAKAGIVWT